MKRLKGEGSWSEQNKNGTVYKRFRIAIDGKQKDFYGRTKTEAYNKYKDYLNTHSIAAKKVNLTLSSAAREMLESKRKQIKQTTYAAYEAEIRFLEKYPIHKIQINSLTSKDIQNYIDSLTETKSIKGIKNQKSIIKMTIDYCLDFGYVKEDLLKKIKLPNEIYVKKPTRQITFLSTEERRLLENESKRLKPDGTPYYIGHGKDVIVFILHTGLRMGEAIALRWDDIDFEKERVHIDKTVSTVRTEKGYKNIETTPKTKNAIRNVPLDETAIGILNNLKGEGYVFKSLSGGLISRYNITRTLNSMVSRAGIDKKVGPHDLRHTFASELIRNGADIKTVSQILGHANVSITLNIYVHKSDDDLDKIKGLIN